MNIVTLSSKNQITLPKAMLLNLGLIPRARLIIEDRNEDLILRPLKSSLVEMTADSLTGYVLPSKLGKSLDKILKETKKKTAYRLAKNL